MLIGPGARPRLWTVEYDAATLPVMHARRHCLLGGLAELVNKSVSRNQLEVLLDVPPDALEQPDEG